MKYLIGIAILVALFAWWKFSQPKESGLEELPSVETTEGGQEGEDVTGESEMEEPELEGGETPPEETPVEELSNNESEETMSENNEELSFTTTSSGLRYAVITEGDGATRPAVTDTVKVHYHGTLEDGSVFDSSVDRGQPIEFPLQNLIPGWQEGIPLMSVGSTYRFVIPPALAYGEDPGRHRLGGKTLTFDVELIEIK